MVLRFSTASQSSATLGCTVMLIIATVLAVGGCGFDPAEIDDRRCRNTDACLVRYGLGWACIQGYCQERKCDMNPEPDLECDDGIFCNGAEVCDPTNEAADANGCIMTERVIDDGIACTDDYCDEEFNLVRNDPSRCPCTADQICAEMNPSPCITATCDTTTNTCTTTLAPLGEPCDDGFACTEDTVCDEGGACVVNQASGSVLNDTLCSVDLDGFFCNGEETCDPTAAGSDPLSGCVAGTPPQADPADDGVACTEVICNEVDDTVIHAPTSMCECQVDGDCARDDCMEYTCNTTTFVCEITGPSPEGTGCDDGLSCTGDDVCDDTGACVGVRSDLLCGLSTTCEGTSACEPDAETADSTTGCTCTPEP